jgi:phage baseplate assembly protein W
MEQIILKETLGGGLVFPLELEQGKIKASEGPDLIKSSLVSILAWPLGTRQHLGEYGSIIETLLEEPNDAISNQTLNYHINEIVNKWEKRVTVDQVKVTKKPDKIELEIFYKVSNSEIQDSFILPYYRNPNY